MAKKDGKVDSSDGITQQVRRVQALVIAGSISKHALAVRAGVRASTLTGLEHPAWNPLASTLSKLIRACDDYEAEAGQSNRRPTRRAAARESELC